MDATTENTTPNLGKPFWFVWSPQGQLPEFRHDSEDLAHVEAQRLAYKHPGRTFVVLQSVCAYQAAALTVTNLRAPGETIPF